MFKCSMMTFSLHSSSAIYFICSSVSVHRFRTNFWKLFYFVKKQLCHTKQCSFCRKIFLAWTAPGRWKIPADSGRKNLPNLLILWLTHRITYKYLVYVHDVRWMLSIRTKIFVSQRNFLAINLRYSRFVIWKKINRYQRKVIYKIGPISTLLPFHIYSAKNSATVLSAPSNFIYFSLVGQ